MTERRDSRRGREGGEGGCEDDGFMVGMRNGNRRKIK
jgi:hypothetical protein